MVTDSEKKIFLNNFKVILSKCKHGKDFDRIQKHVKHKMKRLDCIILYV